MLSYRDMEDFYWIFRLVERQCAVFILIALTLGTRFGSALTMRKLSESEPRLV